LLNVRSQGQSGKHMLALRFSDFDPTRTSTPKFAATQRLAQLGILLGFDH
jgi:hypothetical protein